MLKRLIGLAAVAMVFCMTPQAHAWDIEFAVGAWNQEFTGTLGYEAEVDIDILDMDDFDFDRETRFCGRARLDLPLILPNIYVVAAPMSFEGSDSVAANVTYGDITIPAGGAEVDLEFTLDQYDVTLFWGIPFLKTATAGLLNVDWGINVRWVDLEAKFKATAAGFDEEEKADVSAPIPMVFLACQIMPTDSFAIEAEGRGISVGDNKLWSIIGRVRYNFTGPVFVTGGYRYDDLEVDEDDVEADLEFSGPFVELGLQF